jgi:hypothetical protein
LDLQDQAGEKALRDAYDSNLGQYTTEQEADDLAAEWVTEHGIQPSSVIDMLRTFIKGQKTAMGGLDLGEQDCDALYKNRWRKSDGSLAFAPIGDFTDTHHSVCFRIFNADREIVAHKHQGGLKQVPRDPSGAQWKTLQDRAVEVSGNGNGGGVSLTNTFQVHPLMKKTGALSCSYARDYQN